MAKMETRTLRETRELALENFDDSLTQQEKYFSYTISKFLLLKEKIIRKDIERELKFFDIKKDKDYVFFIDFLVNYIKQNGKCELVIENELNRKEIEKKVYASRRRNTVIQNGDPKFNYDDLKNKIWVVNKLRDAFAHGQYSYNSSFDRLVVSNVQKENRLEVVLPLEIFELLRVDYPKKSDLSIEQFKDKLNEFVSKLNKSNDLYEYDGFIEFVLENRFNILNLEKDEKLFFYKVLGNVLKNKYKLNQETKYQRENFYLEEELSKLLNTDRKSINNLIPLYNYLRLTFNNIDINGKRNILQDGTLSTYYMDFGKVKLKGIKFKNTEPELDDRIRAFDRNTLTVCDRSLKKINASMFKIQRRPDRKNEILKETEKEFSDVMLYIMGTMSQIIMRLIIPIRNSIMHGNIETLSDGSIYLFDTTNQVSKKNRHLEMIASKENLFDICSNIQNEQERFYNEQNNENINLSSFNFKYYDLINNLEMLIKPDTVEVVKNLINTYIKVYIFVENYNIDESKTK